ncbi:low affinity iron permease family protein [Xanthobacter dioxanivorans]|uniref:Low affinity iron permease family protein n=1 Tax=Xanthobacter dioxanivorans TaxID=2528964 RepID=A0A974SL31_9HYPH|nr:low affinity iron permease family protein [Xanthobacter dioxanivorans]QRG08859.1 low affinity iron permease family protein [Xanthobacter dioxanivorans]
MRAPQATPIKELRAQVEQGRAPRPLFTRLSQQVSRYAGKPATFVGAMGVIVAWGLTGPLFGFNDTWQLIINTSTTIVTFLMVFLIQNSQNRDTAALQIKLDELIARLDGPREVLLDLEDLDEEALERLRLEYALLADKARARGDAGARPEPASPAPDTTGRRTP